jgi:hypothetical protein
MADKKFGVKQLDLIGTGTPTIQSANNLNLNATTTAISNDVTVGGNLTVTGSISGGGSLVKHGTVATNTGTEAAFTNIPSTAKKITVAIHNFGYAGTNDELIMEVGDSTGYATGGYQSSYDNRDNGPDARSRTNAYGLSDDTNNGIEQNITVELVNVTGNSWTISHTGGTSDSNGAVIHGGGSISLSNALDRLRIKTAGGRTLDHGHVTVYYETEASTGSGGAIPSGVIMLWSGASNAIPTGYVLCDGNNSTPDLRDKFVVGASDISGTGSWPSVGVGSTGGSANATLPTHTHYTVRDTTVVDPNTVQDLSSSNYLAEKSILNNGAIQYDLKGTSSASNVAKTSSAGSSATNANLPPYYALCYIMKT